MAQKTLAMRPLSTGLFSASFVTDFSRGTNYHAAWTRDNVHVAYAHFVNGRPEVAVNTAKALANFYRTQHARIEAIVREPAASSMPCIARTCDSTGTTAPNCSRTGPTHKTMRSVTLSGST